MKSYAKKKSSEMKVAQKATGGGPPPPPIDEETANILAVINHETEIPSNFDSESPSSVEATSTSKDVQIFEVHKTSGQIRYSL